MENLEQEPNEDFVSLFKYNYKNEKKFTKDIWKNYSQGEIIESFVILQIVLE